MIILFLVASYIFLVILLSYSSNWLCTVSILDGDSQSYTIVLMAVLYIRILFYLEMNPVGS